MNERAGKRAGTEYTFQHATLSLFLPAGEGGGEEEERNAVGGLSGHRHPQPLHKGA